MTWGYDKTERQKIIKSLVKTIVTIVGSFFKDLMVSFAWIALLECDRDFLHAPGALVLCEFEEVPNNHEKFRAPSAQTLYHTKHTPTINPPYH